MGDIKQTNFRVDQETADKFRALCEENGMSQAQGFDHIMRVAELQTAKRVVNTRADEIETIEMHIKAIMEGYLNSLAFAEDTETRVEERYKTAMQARDTMIATLQEKADEAENKIQIANEEKSEAKQKVEKAQKTVTQALKDLEVTRENMEKTEQLNRMLEEKLVDAEEKSKAYDKLKTEKDELEKKLVQSELDIEIKNLKLKELDEKAEEIRILTEKYDALKAEKDDLADKILKKEHELEVQKLEMRAEYAERIGRLEMQIELLEGEESK